MTIKLLSNAWNWKPLQGKKTYLAVALTIVWAGLNSLNYIDNGTYQQGLVVLGALGLAGLRSAKK